MSFIRREIDGSIYMKSRKDVEYLLNPRLKYTKTSKLTSTSKTNRKSNFKLVTVRNLTNYSLEQVRANIQNQQKIIKNRALMTGQPLPFEDKIPVSNDDLYNYYGVFVDEDLYGRKSPVYSFYSTRSEVKCFITANGTSREDWSVHIAHYTDSILNVDGTYTNKWRLVTLDNNLNGINKNFYFLESTSLPDCFVFNYDLSSINYLGGGCWSGMAVDVKDRVPLKAVAPVDGRYIVIGRPLQTLYGTVARSIVAYSFTPSYSFTWCRDKLSTSFRFRECKNTYKDLVSSDGIVKLEKDYKYSLNLTYRPLLTDVNTVINKYSSPEYSEASVTYVGNTNSRICSTFQCPDYGTDYLRTSLEQYTQKTNIIRPDLNEVTLNYPENKISNQPLSYLSVVCSSNNMSNFIKLNVGEASGSIQHGYELKTAIGERSYGYMYPYKFWWVYGKVVNFYSFGDTRRFLTQRTSNSFAGVPAGSMFDFGDLIQAPDYKNAVMTTWNAPSNPPSGFFSYYFGTLQFKIDFLNPPLFGHDGVYYYEINPEILEDSGDDYDKEEVGFTSEENQLRTLQYLYSQMNAGLGGNGLSSIYIGTVEINKNQSVTLLLRNPTENQKSVLGSNPEKFPIGLWDTKTFKLT